MINNDGIENIEEVKKPRGRKPTTKVEIDEVKSEETDFEYIPTAEEIEIERLKTEMVRKDNQLNDFENKFVIMQNQLNLLMQNATTKSVAQSQVDSTNEEMVTIGCNTFGTLAFCTLDGRLNYVFKCGEEKDIELADLKELMKDAGVKQNRNLFIKSLLYFADEKYYKMFKIKRDFIISTEEIVKMLELPTPNDTIARFNEYTNNLSDYNVLHTLNFKIASLLLDQSVPLKKWDYANRVTLEKYIGLQFDDIIAASGLYKMIKNNG